VEVGGQKEAGSRGRQAGSDRQEQAHKSRLAEKKAGMHAGKIKQRRRSWPADRQARTDQKRHLAKQESRLAAKQRQVKAAKDRSRQAEALV
jgi:hypothetical protein